MLLVLLQDGQGVRQSENWLLHLKVEDRLVLPVVRGVVRGLDDVDALQGIFLALDKVLNFAVGDESLFWLLALLVKDTQVIPDF